MSTNQEAKKIVVEEIKNNIKNSKSIVLIDYRGISVAEDTALRKEFRANNVIYKVYKNGGAKEVLFEKLDNDFGNNVRFEYEHPGIFKFSNNDITFANASIAGKETYTRSNVNIIFDN